MLLGRLVIHRRYHIQVSPNKIHIYLNRKADPIHPSIAPLLPLLFLLLSIYLFASAMSVLVLYTYEKPTLMRFLEAHLG